MWMTSAKIKSIKGRFAPSPSGRMHAGNIYAALLTWLLVKDKEGTILLRIEDLDTNRSKREFISQIQNDFEMLGLHWDEGPFFQSTRENAYEAAYEMLANNNLIYPCFCTRAQIKAMQNLSQAPHLGDTFYYSGKCRNISNDERAYKITKANSENVKFSMRLKTNGENICFTDILQGEQRTILDKAKDDFIVKRSDNAWAYQLAVVVDDAEYGVNFVSRGLDLLPSTYKQIYLQKNLGLKSPSYAHFPLLVNEQGSRLAKRDKSASLEELLLIYKNPKAIIGHIAYIAGIIPYDGEEITPEQLLIHFDIEILYRKFLNKASIVFT